MTKEKKKAKKIDSPIDVVKALTELGNAVSNDIEIYQSPHYISTGMFQTDFIVGDKPGMPVGITMFYGGEGCGKTTAAIQAMVDAQKKGLTCFFFNMEKAVVPSLIRSFPELDHTKVSWIDPPNGEACLDGIRAVLRNTKNSYIALDSIPSCLPQSVLDGDAGQHHMAALARLFTPMMTDLKNLCYTSKSILVFTNQKRERLNKYQVGDSIPGGNALKHNCDNIVQMKKRTLIEDDGIVVGHKVECITKKTRFMGSERKSEATLMYGQGFDRVRDIFGMAVQFGLLEKKGSWFIFDEDNKAQGENKAVAYLKSQPKLAQKLEAQVVELLT